MRIQNIYIREFYIMFCTKNLYKSMYLEILIPYQAINLKYSFRGQKDRFLIDF